MRSFHKPQAFELTDDEFDELNNEAEVNIFEGGLVNNDDEWDDFDSNVIMGSEISDDEQDADFSPEYTNTYDSSSDSDNEEGESSTGTPTVRNRVDQASQTTRATRTEPNHRLIEVNEEEEDDDVIKAIIAAANVPRSHPPDIILDDFVSDISFHPDKNLLAVGNIAGDIMIYQYTNDENTLLHTWEMHTKAIRDIEFNLDGDTLFSTSRDKCIMLTDVETGKLKRFYDDAHQAPVYRINVFDDNMFATGDDDGRLKIWDLRDSSNSPILNLKEVDDYISSIITNDAKKIVLITSGDGYLTAINIGQRKMYVQSEPYEEELNCMGLFRSDSKLVIGTSKGRLYTYDWDAFGLHSDMFPGPKSPIGLMVPITDRIAIVAGEEGILRAMHVLPGRNLGVVGQHALGVEAMDISGCGEIIGSSSHDNDIKFWNVKYFEDFNDIKYNEKHNRRKEIKHNLPSSKATNSGDFFADLVQ